jgi:hypothetical protein
VTNILTRDHVQVFPGYYTARVVKEKDEPYAGKSIEHLQLPPYLFTYSGHGAVSISGKRSIVIFHVSRTGSRRNSRYIERTPDLLHHRERPHHAPGRTRPGSRQSSPGAKVARRGILAYPGPGTQTVMPEISFP